MTITNPELELAHDFAQHTDLNIFLTGKAGTGKTTFLHNLKKQTHKRLVVTAPTGVAAINAGGVTLHSFFQMPFGPFVPGAEAFDQNRQHKFGKEKISLIKSLDLLVIDEISMVRADLLDGVDAVLRRFRRSDLPFGGVQLLMIGDLHQLSPVVKEAEWGILQEHYDSMYFFGSRALAQTELIPIELKHIYRQSDTRFIDLLNRVRDNRLDPATLQQLNTRYLPNFTPGDHEGYITLCTHNRDADAINDARLKALPQPAQRFQAEVEGDFPEYSYPIPARLDLKKGAQVMFAKNDPSPDKLYFNGKIGKVTRIAGRTVSVLCPGDTMEIAVEPATWENIKYQLDPATKEISETKVGKFIQFPLKLAWAITIHKSQGLTFERAIVDAQAAFAHGQVYVALSRCKTFEGLVLRSPLGSRTVKTDEAVARFTDQTGRNPPSPERLATAKIGYQQRLLTECFDFGRLRAGLGRLARVLLANARLIEVTGAGDIRDLERQAREEIFGVAENFSRQLHGLFAGQQLPAADQAVLERIAKASVYFQEKLGKILGDYLRTLRIDTDNKEIGKKAKASLDELKKETAVKLAAVKSCQAGFSPAQYLRAISAADLDFAPAKEKKARAVEYMATEVGHPELFAALKSWRAAKAAAAEVPAYRILHQSVLIQLATILPDNPTALAQIKGIGQRTAEKYSKELLALVIDYRQKQGIAKDWRPPAPQATQDRTSKPEKPASLDTRQVSLELFEKGMTVAQVAKERGLTTSTIESHLVSFVTTGRLAIDQLLPKEKQQTIGHRLDAMPDHSLGEIKAALGDNFSYGEIKFMQAHRQSTENKDRSLV